MGKPRKKLSDEEKLRRKREAMRKAREDKEKRKAEQEKDTEAKRRVRQDAQRRLQERERDAAAHRQARLNPERRSQEQEINTAAHREARLDPERRSQEQEINKAAHREARLHPKRRSQERERDTAAHREARLDPERRSQEQEINTAAHREARLDPERRSQEQEINTAAHREARLHPKRRSQERERDTAAHREARLDPERRSQEQEINTAAHREARLDPERRSQEQEINTAAHREARLHPKRRSQERERDTAAHREARLDPERRSQEQESNTAAHREARADPVRRRSERLRNAEGRHTARQDPVKRRRDVETTQISKRRRILATSSLHDQIELFRQKIRESPEYVCSCCGGLFYLTATHVVTEELLLNKGLTPAQLTDLLYVKQRVHRLCDTCHLTATKKKQVHKLCLANGLDFPEVPDVVKVINVNQLNLQCISAKNAKTYLLNVNPQNLSPLEERLVSPYLPFMQIRLCGAEQQSKLKGNVINVENDLDKCAEVLPRNIRETDTIHVQLLRKLAYRTPVWNERITPYNVRKAMEYLITTEAYQEKNIVLSEQWKDAVAGETLEFVTNEEEEPGQRNEEDNNDDDSDMDDTEEVLARVRAEETLILDMESTTMGYRIAPGEGKRPLPFLQDTEMEEITFPTIFGGQKRKLRQLRLGNRLTITDLCKSKVRNRNRVCVKNPSYLFYMFKKSFNQKVRDAIRICMRKQNTGVTAGQIRTPGYLENMIRIDNGYVVFSGVRSTPAYWKKQQKKVVSMVRQLGKCSFFITLSAAETKWTELLQALSKIVDGIELTAEEADNLPIEKKRELIRADPVTCMRHFNHRYRAFLNTLLKPTAPREGIFSPYDVQDYFSRVEFQMRGSPHIHGLFWMKDAPVYDEDNPESEQEIVNFIDKFITCERDVEPDLEELIVYQNHKHSASCRRWHGSQRKCRYRFPQPPLQSTRILHPLENGLRSEEKQRIQDNYAKIVADLEGKGKDFEEKIPFDEFLRSLQLDLDDYITALRSSINRSTVFLKRETNAAFINGYNPTILSTWRANMDIQYVLDTYACAKYCVSYVSKAEGGVSKLLNACLRDIRRGNVSMKEKLMKFGSTLINGSEFSTQECSMFILGLPNTFCSRVDTYVNTSRPDDRIGMLKSEKELSKLTEASDDIFTKGLMDHYVQRPAEMEDTCLAEFATMYNFVKKKSRRRNTDDTAESEDEEEFVDPENAEDTGHEEEDSMDLQDGSGKMKKRKDSTRKILRFRHYSRALDEEEYWREQLMLFVPWKNESDELLNVDCTSKAEIFMETINENSKMYFSNRNMDEDIIQAFVQDAENEEMANETGDNPNDEIILPEEADNYAREYLLDAPSTSGVEKFLPPKVMHDDDFDQLMLQLNVKQRKFALESLHRIKTSDESFHFLLHGGAGVGKSHLTKAVVQLVLRYYNSFPSTDMDLTPVIITSFTGKAAFNVGGMTCSSTFGLRPQQAKDSFGTLNEGSANTLRSKLRNVKLWINDEVSMLGNKMLYAIDGRLRHIMCNTKPFGGISVIFVGHFRQLMPIGDGWAFSTPKHLRAGDLGGLWDLFQIYEMDQIMRQQDQQFCKALNNMSEGVMDAEDIELMKGREMTENVQPPQDAIWLFYTNEECKSYNQRIHNSLNTDGFLSIANDKVEAPHGHTVSPETRDLILSFAKNLNVNQCEGLNYEVPLKVGAVYLVACDIDVSDGLFNGANGHLMQIDYGTTGDGRRLPYRIWMKFLEESVGQNQRRRTQDLQTRMKIPLEWVLIDKLTKNLSKVTRKGVKLVRTQFPLLAANAMTVAKSQGSTMSSVVVGLPEEGSFRRDELYVASSRSRTLERLFYRGTFKKPAANDVVTRELRRLETHPLAFRLMFFDEFPSRKKLYFHNIQSFRKHGMHLLSDVNVLNADLIALVEPKLLPASQVDSRNYQVVCRENGRKIGNSVNSEGALILSQAGAVHVETIKDQRESSHMIIVITRMFNCFVAVVYKDPHFNVSTFLEVLEAVLAKYSSDRCIFVGDINIRRPEPEGERLVNVFLKYGCNSMLPPNAHSTNLGTTIDYCFSNMERNDIEARFYESFYSFHKPICVVFK